MIDKMFRLAGLGLTAGAALIVFGPPALRAARPLARQAMKTAIIGYVQGREALAHITETFEDAYAEAMGELVAEAVASEGAAEPPAAVIPQANGNG